MFLNIELFDQTIEEWKKYRDIKAKFGASIVEGGTMYSMIYSGSLTTTTKEKNESLQTEYAIDLRRLASSWVVMDVRTSTSQQRKTCTANLPPTSLNVDYLNCLTA